MTKEQLNERRFVMFYDSSGGVVSIAFTNFVEAVWSTYWYRQQPTTICRKPPAGWGCSRKPNHKGPCAAGRPLE